jgi:hypothetical protein
LLKRFIFDLKISLVNTRINHISSSAARLFFLLGGDYNFIQRKIWPPTFAKRVQWPPFTLATRRKP